MNINKWVQFTLLSFCILILAACSSSKRANQAAINAANSAYHHRNGAYASGLGSESEFADGVNTKSKAADAERETNRIYLFDYDSNVVHAEDKPAILANANYLVGHRNAKVLLEGHTDPRGSREYNIGLGERRAKAVAAILTAQGVNPSQIRVVSYGAEKLASPGRSESDYQQDRRVVLVYTKR